MPTEDRLLRALESWARRHSRPDQPVLHVGRRRYSPREIVAEVRNRTPTGAFFRAVIENPEDPESVEKVLEAFEGACRVS